MTTPIIFADFNNADEGGRVRLNCNGTIEDIQRLEIELKEGMQMILYDDEALKTIGIVKYSEKESIWVAEINRDNFK